MNTSTDFYGSFEQTLWIVLMIVTGHTRVSATAFQLILIFHLIYVDTHFSFRAKCLPIKINQNETLQNYYKRRTSKKVECLCLTSQLNLIDGRRYNFWAGKCLKYLDHHHECDLKID
jgi:hypothetical protein